MKKQELLNDLSGRAFVGGISTVTLRETKPDGTKWYQANIREAMDKVCTYRNVDFYVVDEGGPSEAAFYKDEEPRQTVVDAQTAKAHADKAKADADFQKECQQAQMDYHKAMTK